MRDLVNSWGRKQHHKTLITLEPSSLQRISPSLSVSLFLLPFFPSLFVLEVAEGGVSGWSEGGVKRCRALMLVGAHSAGQYTVLHLVPRLCINSTPVTIYSSRPSSIWRTEQGAKRVLLPSHQSEANLLQCKTHRAGRRGGGYREALVWDLWPVWHCFFIVSLCTIEQGWGICWSIFFLLIVCQRF